MSFSPSAGSSSRQRAGLLVLRGQTARDDLRGLDVGLVERIDPQHRAGDGGRKFPAIEFGAERVPIGPVDAHHRMARAFEPLDEARRMRDPERPPNGDG